MSDELEWFARNMADWPGNAVAVFRNSNGNIMRVVDPRVMLPEGAIRQREWEMERDRLFSGRIDIIGQNGNDGEHYDQAATVRDMSEPVIYTTVQALRVHHDDGHIDVTAVHAGGVVLVDQEGGETHIPSLAVLDAVRDAMTRIVGE